MDSGVILSGIFMAIRVVSGGQLLFQCDHLLLHLQDFFRHLVVPGLLVGQQLLVEMRPFIA